MGCALYFTAQMMWFGLAIAVPLYGNDRFEGDSCTLADGVTNGTCRRDVDCSDLGWRDWEKCSSFGNVAIVCCRDESPNRLPRGFISKLMCDGFPLVPDASNRIFNGNRADTYDFPYLGALGYKDGNNENFTCSASLISREYMLTAAHCVMTREKPTFVRLGALNIFNNSDSEDKPVDVGFEKVIIHPNYRARRKNALSANDIALLKLNITIDRYKDFLIPACLYTNLTDPAPHINLSIAGWGSNGPNNLAMSADLMKANVTIFNREECYTLLSSDNFYPNTTQGLPSYHLCAIGKNATGEITGDACIGDSGGPLGLSEDRRRYIVGLTSAGKPCGTNFTGIYTRVSHFIDWIELVVWPAQMRMDWVH